MSPHRRPRIPLHECVICEGRTDSQWHCYLCGGLGITPLKTFNKYKRGEIEKRDWVHSSGPPPPVARGDWITVTLRGGPHHGVRMTWPVDEPPQIGQELPLPVEADLGNERLRAQDPLFQEPATYVIERGSAGLRAVYRQH